MNELFTISIHNQILIIGLLISVILLLRITIQKHKLLSASKTCFKYLDPKGFSREEIKPEKLFVSLINKLSLYIDSELENGALLDKQCASDKVSINFVGTRLILVTKNIANSVKIVDCLGECLAKEEEKLEHEISLLCGARNTTYHSLDTSFYSHFHRYKISYLWQESFQKYCDHPLAQDYSLWFGFSNQGDVSLFVIMKIKKFAREYATTFFQKQQIQGLNGKIAKSRQNNILKGKLISGLSHDLRSPINNLQAIYSCLNDHAMVTSSGVELLDMANANLRVLNELIEDFLSLAKFRSGNLLAQPENFLLGELLTDIFQIYQFDTKLKGLNFNFDFLSEDIILHTDRLHLKRIICNLLSNAIKYTPKGSVRLSYSFQNVFCQISIQDTGVGLSKDQISTICRPFVRFSDQEIEGVGLGLAITKLLIELNSGKLEIFSETGKGSEFRVILPMNSIH